MVIVYKSAADFVEAAMIFALHNVLYCYQESMGATHTRRNFVAFFDKLGNLHRGEYVETGLIDPDKVYAHNNAIYYKLGEDSITLEGYTSLPDSDLQKQKKKILQLKNDMISWAECLDALSSYTQLDVETIKA